MTSEIGFIEAPLDRVADWYQSWDDEIHEPSRRLTRAVVEGDLAALLRRLLPLTSVLRRRILLVPTASRWTAFFDNGHTGADAGRASVVARGLACHAIRMAAVPDTLGRSTFGKKRGRYGASIFELYGPHETEWLNSLRTICAVNDGGRWVFSAQGAVLPFEHPQAYETRRAAERFPFDLLDEYLRALDIRAFDEAFYAPERKAILFERTGPKPPQMREYSLEEARAEFGDA